MPRFIFSFLPSVHLSWAAAAVALGSALLGPTLAAAGQRVPSDASSADSLTCPAAAALTDGAGQPFAAVRYLADDALQGRLAGSAGEGCAARYLAEEFHRIGLEPAGRAGGYFQPVPLASAVNPHAPGGTGRNVIGLLRGGDPELAGEAVVIGAHYDHLGLGSLGSVHPDDRGQIHNGADDNASGVAGLLTAAKRLADGPRPARTLVFAAFTGEELGLLGSAQYVREPTAPIERTRAMLNLDMVGRLGSDPLIVYGTGTAVEWEGLVSAESERAGVEVAFQEEGFGPSDHTSFYARDVPVLHLFTNVHGDYHRPSDDWEKIDLEGIERVAALVARIAYSVAERRELLTLRRGAGTPPGLADAEERRGYGAYLGTIPDFAPVERGVRLNGVGAGSPAERAGLRAGDILVGFEDREIPDLRALADALREHSPGDTVQVRVLRGDDELTLTAVLGQRGAARN